MADILITPGDGTLVFYSGAGGIGELGRFTVTESGVSYTSTVGSLTVDNLVVAGGMDLGQLDTLVNILATDYVVVEQSGVIKRTLVSDFLADAGTIKEIVANEGVYISGSYLGTVYNTTIGDNVTNVAVGGLGAGTAASVLKTKSIVEILDDILFPTLEATIASNRSVSLDVSGGGGTLEVGTSVNRSLTADFSEGSITNGDGTAGPSLVGAATQYTFTGTGINSTAQSGSTLSLGSVTVVDGSNNWAVTTDYDAGSGAYYDNKSVAGSNLDGSRVSGSVSDSSSSPTIAGLYPYFYGLSNAAPVAGDIQSAIAGGAGTKVVASSTGTINVQFNATSANYLWFAVPSTSADKTVWYVNALNNGSIGGGSNLFGNPTTLAVDSPESYWSSINYDIYITNYATTTGSDTMQLRNS